MGGVLSAAQTYGEARSGNISAQRKINEKAVSWFMFSLIALMVVIFIACIFGFTSSAMLLMAADQEKLSHQWKKNARGVGGWNIVLFGAFLLPLSIYVMVNAIKFERHSKTTLSSLLGGNNGVTVVHHTALQQSQAQQVNPMVGGTQVDRRSIYTQPQNSFSAPGTSAITNSSSTIDPGLFV